MNVIDLTHPLIHGQGAYPGASYPEYEWRSTFENKGRNTSVIKMSTHSGTHIDAPLHFIPGGGTIDQTPLDKLCGYARLIDVSQFTQHDRLIDEDEFLAAMEVLQPHEIALIYTGLETYFGKPEFLTNLTALTYLSVQRLVEKEITAFGIDTYSVDLLEKNDFANHKLLLGSGIPIIEALNNLTMLPGGRFFFCAFPLRLNSREASPCRAVAFPDISISKSGNSNVYY